jgi:hypothetical protein
MVRHFESRRMWLECLDCGEESDGWTISQARRVAGAKGGVVAPPLRPVLSAWSR